MSDTKICGKCRVEKPACDFSKRSKSIDGLAHTCKPCVSIYLKDYYKNNKEQMSAKSKQYHLINKCHQSMLKRIYREENKEEIRQKKSKYYKENKVKIREKRALFYQENKEIIKEKCKEYRNQNKEKIDEVKRNQRATKRGAEGRHANGDVRRIFEAQRGLCASCESRLFKSGKNKFHVDHIMPLSKGGSNWPDNLQCLCPECNLKKSAKDPIDWANQNGKLI